MVGVVGKAREFEVQTVCLANFPNLVVVLVVVLFEVA